MANVLYAPFLGRRYHDLHRVAPVAPIGVNVKVALYVLLRDKHGDFALSCNVNLPYSCAYLGRDVLKAKPGVKTLLVREMFNLASGHVGDAVFVDGKAHLVSVVSQANGVLLAACKVIQHGAEAGGFDHSQVNLDAVPEDDRRLCLAVTQDLQHVGQANQRVQSLLRLLRDTDQVNVSYGFLEAAQAASYHQSGHVGTTLTQSRDHALGYRHGLRDRHSLVFVSGELDFPQYVVCRFLAHAGHVGQLAVCDGLLKLGYLGNANLFPQSYGGLGAKAGDVH